MLCMLVLLSTIVRLREGGSHVLLYKSCHEDVHSARSSKRRENGGNMNPILEHRLCGQRHGLAMNWVDRPHTSADEQVLSGHRAVVIA